MGKGINYYTVIPASVRYDKELNHGAKLLYGEIVAIADWESVAEEDITHFINALDCDRRTVYRYLQLLEQRGHIERIENKRVRLVTTGHHATPKEEIPRDTDFYKEFFNTFERGLSTVVEKKELYYDVLDARLEKFSKSEILRALANRVAFINASTWHQQPENKHNAIDPSLLVRDDNVLLKWLNTKVEKPTDQEVTPFKFN